MNKFISLPIICLLVGCVDTTSKIDFTAYDRLTSGEKTMQKAFEVYDLIGGCNKLGPNAQHFGYIQNSDKTLFYTRDFIYRFTETLGDVIEQARYVQMFDKDDTLTEKDRYCLSMNAPNKFINNEDECLLTRRKLFADTNVLSECVFNYENYIPADVSIYDENTFVSLKDAYNKSKRECIKKRENKEIIETELQECIAETESKLDKIVKSNELNTEPVFESNLDKFLEQVEKSKEDRTECSRKVALCGKQKTKGCYAELSGVIDEVNNQGIILRWSECPWCNIEYSFIYTQEKFDTGKGVPTKYYFEYVGTYKYTGENLKNILNTHTLPAYKITKRPVHDVCNKYQKDKK